MSVIFEFANNILMWLYWITGGQRTGFNEGIQNLNTLYAYLTTSGKRTNKTAQNCHLLLYRSKHKKTTRDEMHIFAHSNALHAQSFPGCVNKSGPAESFS